MCNYFFSNSLKSYKMSVAKVKVAQNRHVCDHSERKLQAMFYAVNSLCDYSNPERGLL